MGYLVAFIIAFLLHVSIYRLGKKYLGKEPYWLRIYSLLVLAIIFITPVNTVNNWLQSVNLTGAASFFAMFVPGLIAVFLAIKFYPNQVFHKDGFREYE
ncbi:hypothetical protein ACFVHQ_01405 [Actinomycetes bacterium NPDC127524]